MNTTTTPIDQGETPINQARFAARYARYNMDSHGMTQLSPEATKAIEDMPKIEEQLLPTPWKPTMAWTKPDLVKACRCYGLSPAGNKAALLGRLQTALA